MSGFSFIQMTNLSHMSWKYWIMINYEKTKQKQTNKQTKKARVKIEASIGQNWLIDWLVNMDWPSDVEWLYDLTC